MRMILSIRIHCLSLREEKKNSFLVGLEPVEFFEFSSNKWNHIVEL